MVPPSAHSHAPKTLWLGAAGTAAAFGILTSVRERWGNGVRVIAGEIHPPHLIAASALADAFEQIPRFAAEGYEAHLLARLAECKVDYYLPILDEEILFAARWRDAGRLGPVRTVGLPIASAEICLDKLAAARWLESQGLPTPVTTPAAEARFQGAPLFAKPRRGRGSVGAKPIPSAEALAAIADDPDLVVQEGCRGPEITLDGFRASDGRVFRAVARERLEVKAGVCTKARVFEDDGLADLARAVADGLGLTGAFCIQVMRAPRGDDHVVTDINPRAGGGTRLSVAAGVDTLAAAVADGLGLEDDLGEMLSRLAGDVFVVRQHREFVLG